MKKKILIIAAVLTTLFIIGGFYFFNKYNSEEQPNVVNPAEEGINLSPPTENDKAENDAHKESLDDSDADGNTTVSPGNVKDVEPQIVYSGQQNNKVEVSSRVPGVFEESGNCTLKLVNGAKSVQQSKKALQNVNEMSCGLIQIDRSKLSAGKWTATVSYESTKAKGVSNPVSIDVK